MMDEQESVDTNIAIIGAGKGGKAILSVLLKIQGIRIKYICDVDPDAPGFLLAKKNDIECIIGSEATRILEDPEVDLIFEVTGSEEVFSYLQEHKSRDCNIMGASTAKIMWHLLDTQQRITSELRLYKLKLAEMVIDRTDELEIANRNLHQQLIEYQALNKKLQEINDEKTKYLLNATHQLKAPFAAIQSYVDILLDGYTDILSGKTLQIIQKIRARCEFLSTSIRRMLELANLKSCVEENIRMSVELLQDIVEKSLTLFSGILNRRNIDLTFQAVTDSSRIECNREQIETLVQILIDNAINYSEDNSTILVAISHDAQKRVVLTISDNGIGIKEEHLKRIFDEYFRSNNAVRKNKNGTGLGLSIAKRIAQIHRTDIFVDSTLGEGSVFRVAFPRYIGS